MEQWIYHEKPTVRFATNTFINVPIILRVDDKPLIKIADLMEKNIPAGYTTEFEIYNKDGVYIAKVKGSRVFLTPDGEKSNLKLRNPNRMTVCELDGKTLFEMIREEAAALKTQAELYTPNGSFIKGNDEGLAWGEALSIGGLVLKENVFENSPIGIQVNSIK